MAYLSAELAPLGPRSGPFSAQLHDPRRCIAPRAPHFSSAGTADAIPFPSRSAGISGSSFADAANSFVTGGTRRRPRRRPPNFDAVDRFESG